MGRRRTNEGVCSGGWLAGVGNRRRNRRGKSEGRLLNKAVAGEEHCRWRQRRGYSVRACVGQERPGEAGWKRGAQRSLARSENRPHLSLLYCRGGGANQGPLKQAADR